MKIDFIALIQSWIFDWNLFFFGKKLKKKNHQKTYRTRQRVQCVIQGTVFKMSSRRRRIDWSLKAATSLKPSEDIRPTAAPLHCCCSLFSCFSSSVIDQQQKTWQTDESQQTEGRFQETTLEMTEWSIDAPTLIYLSRCFQLTCRHSSSFSSSSSSSLLF